MTPVSDVWLFGLCLIEMATREIPYSEFTSDNARRAAILARDMPRAFGDVSDPDVADLALMCLLPVNQRPSVAQLRESDLFSEIAVEAPPAPKSPAHEIIEIAPPAAPDPRDSPKFQDLIKKQKAEHDELLIRHKREIDDYRSQHRATRANKAVSIRELLNEK
jgi:WNK lysine deficient protein kinase